MSSDEPRNEPAVDVRARLLHDVSKDEVVIFIGDAPVKIPQKRMPKTYEKLLGEIEKARQS